MVAMYVAKLESLVSQPRLERYRPPDRDDLQTAVNYLWNVALSEALLQGLSAVEIGLRNSIHTVLSTELGTGYWFWPFLLPDDLDHFNREWIKLRRSLGGSRPTPGKVVAAQTFGFWHRIFESRYDSIWSTDRAKLLWNVFPHHPRQGVQPSNWLTTNKIELRTKLFLDLRNRVMHHEPIFQGIARPDEQQQGQPMPVVQLDEAHSFMLEFLAWIDPQLLGALRIVDRFPVIHASGRIQIETDLKNEIIRTHGSL